MGIKERSSRDIRRVIQGVSRSFMGVLWGFRVFQRRSREFQRHSWGILGSLRGFHGVSGVCRSIPVVLQGG